MPTWWGFRCLFDRDMDAIAQQIQAIAADPDNLLTEAAHRKAVRQVIRWLTEGRVRVAEPAGNGWRVNAWVKQAVLLYFRIQPMRRMVAGEFMFYDKIPLRQPFPEPAPRTVPMALVRHGAFVHPGAVLMPSYVNIGAYVDEGTMVDTWATVGSCAQIGRRVHLSGGVGIGGVLEPVQAAPVIVEDDVFVGSRSILVEGVRVGKGAVIGANTVVTASTPIIDVTASEPKEFRGYVPPYSVVIPGVRPKRFPAGEYHLPCALIIGRRSEKTDRKTSLNEVLRRYNVQV